MAHPGMGVGIRKIPGERGKSVDEDRNHERLISYLEALEAVNLEMLASLKKCLKLLSQLRRPDFNRSEWENMLEDIERIIQAGEKVHEEKAIH